MLALMASRNVKETTALVERGDVCNRILEEFINLTISKVGQLYMVSFLFLWTPTQYFKSISYSHSRFSRIWTDRSSYTRQTNSIWIYSMYLHFQSLFSSITIF